MLPFEQMAKGFVCSVELVKGGGLPDRDQEVCLHLLGGGRVCNPFILMNVMPL